MSPIFLAIREE
jgi:ankyrin repeat protein